MTDPSIGMSILQGRPWELKHVRSVGSVFFLLFSSIFFSYSWAVVVISKLVSGIKRGRGSESESESERIGAFGTHCLPTRLVVVLHTV